MNIATRSQAKTLLKKGLVCVNGEHKLKPETKVDENTVSIVYQGKEYKYIKNFYYLMNKPKSVVTATEDKADVTVMDIFYKEMPDAPKGLFPVGRLDKDTTGLLFITNDGQMAHDMLSPKKHVEKTYFVTLDKELLPEAVEALQKGVHIGEGEDTLPAVVDYDGGKTCYITIVEGKFHQVKRMFFAVGCQVVELKRVAFGDFRLDETILKSGKVINITDQINAFSLN